MRGGLLALFLIVIQLFGGAAYSQEWAPDEVLVKFRSGTSAQVRAAVHQAMGGTVRDRVAALGVDVVALPPGTTPQQAAVAYSRSPNVQYAEANPICVSTAAPNDPLFGQEWGMSQIQLPLAWNVAQGREDIAIAILDSGIAQDHDDLAPKVVATQNFSSSPTADDLFGHGTHLAGIAAAMTDNGTGIAGVGYRCSLMNGKVSEDSKGNSKSSWVAQGIVWAADSGARVICMSFGSPTPSQTVEDAVNYAWNRGVVLVASAGNTGATAPTAPNYPAFYEHCIAVAAVDQGDQRPGWSNFGSWVDVAAPGVGILSTLPNRANFFGQQGYGIVNGTSQAAAFVAGLAGLLWSTPFGSSNASVRARLEATCDRIPGTGQSWASGRINAARAVGAAP
jgi:thermitase